MTERHWFPKSYVGMPFSTTLRRHADPDIGGIRRCVRFDCGSAALRIGMDSFPRRRADRCVSEPRQAVHLPKRRAQLLRPNAGRQFSWSFPGFVTDRGSGFHDIRGMIFSGDGLQVQRRRAAVRTTIVIADDDNDLRSIYADLLRHAGYDVFEAANGREALDLVASQHPALLLLDVWMPGLNGFEVLDHLRLDPQASETKVVMLSNLGDSDSLLEGYSAGVFDFLVKGLSLEDLLDHVRQAISSESLTGEPV